MRAILAVAIGRLVRHGIRLFRPGGGSSVPGRVAAFIYPDLLVRALKALPQGVAVVSGSAGKSSTTKALVEIVRGHGVRVFTNPSTSNIRQGFYSSILQFGDWRGRLKADLAILEWDEGHGAVLSNNIKPKLAVLTNVLSDQLDRFVDPDFVIEKLRTIAMNSDRVIANGNDSNLTQFLVGQPNVRYFGLSKTLQARTDAPLYALNFEASPEVELQACVTSVSERVSMKLLDQDFEFKPIGSGFPQALNTAAAILAARELVRDFDLERTVSTLEELPPVFARDEIVQVEGKTLRLMLVQNPTSFQLNLDELKTQPELLMILAGTDIHDPSWLWTVDFSNLTRVDVVGGHNAHALALRLRYQGIVVESVVENVPEAVDKFLGISADGVRTVLFSADGMRRMRRHLRLAK
ncbi:MAG: hypothetical protein RIS51_241 [Actinomycetota bacterium]